MHRKEAQHFEEVASFQEEVEEQLSEIIQEYTLKVRQMSSIECNNDPAVMYLSRHGVGPFYVYMLSLLYAM